MSRWGNRRHDMNMLITGRKVHSLVSLAITVVERSAQNEKRRLNIARALRFLLSITLNTALTLDFLNVFPSCTIFYSCPFSRKREIIAFRKINHIKAIFLVKRVMSRQVYRYSLLVLTPQL